MTRLFDALSKARSDHTARDPVVPPVQSAPVSVRPVQSATAFAAPVRSAPASGLPVPMKAVPHATEWPTAPDDGARRRIVVFDGLAELPTDVVREMTGLRISLEAALTQRIPRTVMFIASQGGEGTSTVAAQFAQSLASDERLRVLLVDAHVRRPAYEPDGWPTAGQPVNAARRRPAEFDAPSPDLMPLSEESLETGTLTPDSLRGSLDAVASGYDWIVVDGPPVLESPDAATLGAVADGVVVVVQAGRTKRPVLTRSVDLMNRAGGRVLGMVLNRRRLEIPEFIYRRI
jgi:Mrp family chromosome partitioning ATPase